MDKVERSSGISGTDIAALVGLSPHKTAFGVYCEKVGIPVEVEQTDRMKMGKLLEPVVVKLYEQQTGERVDWWGDRTIRHPSQDIVIGTPDGFVRPHNGVAIVADATFTQPGFEAKTAGLDQAWRWGEGDFVPQEYLLQVQWYMLLTGRNRWLVACLIGGDVFKVFELAADEQLQGMLLQRAQKFWRDHVEKRNPPDIDSSDAATAYLRRTYPHSSGAMREANTRERELMAACVRAKQELKVVKSTSEMLENQLRDAIGAARGVYDPDTDTRATWSDVAESPVPAYTRSAYRRLTVRSKREES